jgi:hypothetical protein
MERGAEVKGISPLNFGLLLLLEFGLQLFYGLSLGSLLHSIVEAP